MDTPGRFGGAVIEDTEQLRVRAKLEREAWQNSDSLLSLQIPLPGQPGNPRFVPLAAIGNLNVVPDDAPIGRRDGERINQVQAFLTRGVLPEEALKLLQRSLEEDPIPYPTDTDTALAATAVNDPRSLMI